jgi:SpoVK/Ycf46/Vps4 family AAA+-type ATPase
MEHLREISKIAEWGMKGDKKRLVAYLNRLIEKVENAGDIQAAERLRRATAETSTDLQPSSFGTPTRLPVDSESRLSLADEEVINENDIEIILNRKTKKRVDEFIGYVDHSEALEKHGVGVAPSLITYGPPGTGKTQLARYIASRLKRPLITARADTLISSFLGSTSKNLRTLFDHVAHRHCILFLDEIDAFAKLRDDAQELGELKRVVVSLLQNIDAMDPQTVLIAATNHEHMLDPAIWRRFSFKINILPPEIDEREKLFKIFLGQHAKRQNIKLLADLAESMTGSDIRSLAQDAVRDAVVRDRKTIDAKRLLWQLIEARLDRNIDAETGIPTDICDVRNLSRNHFKYSLLAEMFHTSESTISRRIKQGEANG